MQCRKISIAELSLLCLIMLLGHGLLLMNDGVYWDGWLYHLALKGSDWSTILEPYRDSGLPQEAWLIWYIGQLPFMPQSFHVVCFVAIFLCAVAVYRTGLAFNDLSRVECFFIAVLMMLYPAWDHCVAISAVARIVAYCCFLWAVWLAIFLENKTGVTHVIWRVVTLVLFFASFTLNALLVLFIGFLAILYSWLHRDKNAVFRADLPRFLVSHADYLFLPVLFWIVKELCFPRLGLYEGYNRFVSGLVPFAKAMAYFAINGIYAPFNQAFLNVLQQPFAVLLAMFFALSLLGLMPTIRTELTEPRRHNALWMFVIGLFLLFLAAFPYAAVGLSPAPRGWASRHAVLLGLPLAIMAVAMSRFAASILGRQLSAAAVLLALALGFALSDGNRYADWQVRWIKDQSVMAHLEQSAEAKDVAIFWIDDRCPAGGEKNYRFYEWSSIFRQVWNDQKRAGIDLAEPGAVVPTDRRLFSSRYSMKDFDPNGPQGVLTLTPGPAWEGSWRMIARYFYFKLLMPQMMRQWLNRVVDVTVTAVDARPRTYPQHKEERSIVEPKSLESYR